MTALIISYNDDIDPDIVAGVATVGSIKKRNNSRREGHFVASFGENNIPIYMS